MDSKKCTAKVGEVGKQKECGAVCFFDPKLDEQCPKECAHCGAVINPEYDDELHPLDDNGPTFLEWVKLGNTDPLEYPDEGFKAKPWTVKDMEEVVEMVRKGKK